MSATLDGLLEPIEPFLNDEAVEEICCQRPGEVWIFKHGQYDRHYLPALDAEHIEDLAICAAAQRRLDVWRDMPPLDTDLRGRGRLSAIFQPLVEEGLPCITIRRGGTYWPTLSDLRAGGLFKKAKAKQATASHPELVKAYIAAMSADNDVVREEMLERFFVGAAAANLTIVGCGTVASGKSTFLKAYIRAVPRSEERIITIADTAEMIGLEDFFPNSVQLFYDKNETRDGMRAADLIIAALRMRPNRLIVQEVRDGNAALALIDGLMSGHPGSTTVHANSCEAAFERFKFVIKKTPAGAAIKDEDVIKQLKELVDVVVHFQSRSEDTDFAIDEVWFREAQQ